MRRSCLTLATPVALMLPAVAAAQDVRTGVDVVGTAGYSNNPFALSGSDTGAAFVSIEVLPRLQLVGPTSALTLSGSAQLQQYLRRYSSNDSYSGAIDYNVRPSERLTGHARLDLSSAVVGGYESYLPRSGASGFVSQTGTAGPGIGTGLSDIGVGFPTVNDIALYGLRDRRRFARLSGDASDKWSTRDTITLSGYAEESRYRRITLGDYDGYGATLGYSRRVSESVGLGLRGSGTLYDYKGVSNNTRIFALEGTANLRLNAVWSLDGALGASFVDSATVGSTTRTSLSGDLDLCRRGPRSNMCVTAARHVSATGLVGSQYVTTLGANWALRLSERDNVSWNASYSHVGTDNRTPASRGFANEFLRFSAGYDRQIAERLRLVASANVRKLFGAQDKRPLDYGGQVGVSFRLGSLR